MIRFFTTITALIMLATSTIVFAQLLPVGVGAYTFGYRQFNGDPSYFDGSGANHSVGSKFDQDFNSEQMASGANGADLQRLYRGLKQYDAQSADASADGNASSDVADQLNLGRLRGDVKAKVEAKYIAMAYGVHPKWTVYFGVPFVTATVDTSLNYSGVNNAQNVQNKLGDLAYDELQTGLQKASQLSASSVTNTIENDYGYAPIDHWEYKGLGDVFLGARTQYNLQGNAAQRNSVLVAYQLDLPTGHSDDPDILTDTPIGRGYYATSVTASPKSTFGRAFIGGEFGLTYGFARQTQRRVPLANESLVPANRKADVTWQPGQDGKFAAIVGVEGQVVQSQYKIGGVNHTRDHYRGSLAGNYDALESNSTSQVRYHEASIQFSSVKAYHAKQFAVPFILSLTAHSTLAGRNISNSQYFEISIMSFFKGP